MIKSVGASEKSPQAGGSYGIGKNAPFTCSQLRTVFYGTRDCDGTTAFQGVARLVSHKDKEGQITRGTGYYGILEKNRPITEFSQVDEVFHREKIGTDVFVAGFNDVEGWEGKIVASVIENFFVAIQKDQLVVRVEDTVVNSQTLPDLLEKYKDKIILADKYYQALISKESKRFEESDFEGLGEISLFLLPKKDYPKKVAMVRGTGMKIFDKGHFRTPLKFAGVMIAEGAELNKKLRIMEPPSHNDWEPERYEEDEAYARRLKKRIFEWINDKLRSLTQFDECEELDVEGISQYLPDDSEEAPLSREEQSKGGKDSPMPIEIRKDNGSAKATDVGGGEPGTEGNIPIDLRNVRIFCSNYSHGEYQVSFCSDVDKKGFLRLYVIGEDNRERVSIKEAKLKKAGKKVTVNNKGEINPFEFKAGENNVLLVKLEEPLRCSLEVRAYENRE